MSERHPAPKSTHGHRPSLVSPPPETGGGIEQEVPQFKCPLWPHCNCPGGTVRPECPGLNDLIEDDGFITVYPPTGGNR